MLHKFKALPSYFGGKQKLVNHIFKHLPNKKGLKFLDCFQGAGSISMFAKARGYNVVANDWGFLPEIIGRAVLENNKSRISMRSMISMINHMPDINAELNEFMKPYFLKRDIDILARMRTHLNQSKGLEYWQTAYTMWKFIQKIRPFGGDLTNKIALEEYKAGNINTETNETKIKFIKNLRAPRKKLFKDIVKHYNAAIFPGQMQFNRQDVFDFIADHKDADIIYLDPPYTGAQSYETKYHDIEWIIRGRQFDVTKSGFNTKDGLFYVHKLGEACAETNAKILVLSFWTEKIDETELIKAFKPFNLKKVPITYRYVYGTSVKESGSQEFLGVGIR